MTCQELKEYFERVGLEFSMELSLEQLSTLQNTHMHTFPFENINPFLSLPVLLDKDSLFRKFIYEKRGGYCFEQNVFFMYVLQALGYGVRGLLGNVFHKEEMIERRTHMLLLVQWKGKPYVVDVGFGSMAADTPLLLETNIEQQARAGVYRLLTHSDGGYRLQVRWSDDWRTLYAFELQKQYIEDFDVCNWYTSTCPKAHFMHTLQVSFKSAKARYTLDNNKFTTYYHTGEKETKLLQSVVEMRNVLEAIFKIQLNDLPNLDTRLQEIL